MPIKIIKSPVKKSELEEIARKEFGDVVKAVVDTENEIMAVGGELHSDEEVLLQEQENSQREHLWGINLYPQKSEEEWIEFDSMINLKPALGNRSREVENLETKELIRRIVKNLITK